MHNIIKPGIDTSEYEFFVLDNKLKVYFNYDESVIASSVSLIVDVGFDKDEIDGTAHLLEHMLFIGSEKYPEKNYFQKFMSTNGGDTNAFTKFNATCYYYTIANEYLLESLDIFAHFFINPLLTSDDINKEKNAVNAEHDKNLNNDGWIYNHMIHLMCIDAINKFGTGNRSTLNVQNIATKVNEYYNKYYSSNIITLYVSTNLKIKSNISELFNKIKNKNVIIDTEYHKLFPMTYNEIKLIPNDDVNKLIIYWDIPSYITRQDISPIDFIINILLRTHDNSLLYMLKYKYNYIYNYDINITDIYSNRNLCEFNISLTDLGFNNIPHIYYIINSYLQLLIKNAGSDNFIIIYNEIVKLNKYNFYYLEFDSPMNKLMYITILLSSFKFKPELLLCCSYYRQSITEQNKNIIISNITNCLTEMLLNKACIIIGSKQNKIIDQKIDKFYNIKYQMSSINTLSLFNDKLNFELPLPNPYISFNNRMTNATDTIPIELAQINTICSYLLETNKYKTPVVFVLGILEVPKVLSENVKIYTSSIIYFNILKTIIEENLQLCQNAGYSINIRFLNLYLKIEISGNYKHILNITRLLFRIMMNEKLIKQELFEHAKNDLNNTLQNYKYKLPMDKLNNNFNKFASKFFYSHEEMNTIINSLSFDDILRIPKTIYDPMHVSLIICGNTNYDQATDISNIFSSLSTNNIANIPTNNYIIPLPNKKIITKSDNNQEINNICGYFIELFSVNYEMNLNIERDIRDMCIFFTLLPLINVEYFTNLRTTKSFGYIVNAKSYSLGHYKCPHYYIKYTVQSSTKTIDEIITNTEEFINVDFLTYLTNLSNDELEQTKQVNIESLEQQAPSLNEFAHFILLQQISNSVNITNLQIDIFKSLTKEDLIYFYNDKFIKNKKYLILGIEKTA
jgi:insulysin